MKQLTKKEMEDALKFRNYFCKQHRDIFSLIHFSKIDDSDTIAIIRKPDGTIGEDTKADVDYALGQGKEVVWVETIE